MGQVLREQGDAECVQQYLEAITYGRRIGDKQTEAIAEYNLGNAYLRLPAIRGLDAAEAAYQRSLDLRNPNDA